MRRAQLQAIIEHLADGILIVDAGGEIRFANPAAASIFGRTSAELEGSSFGYALASGEPVEIDVVLPGGGTVAAELRASAIEFEGRPSRLVSVRDVTERRRAEEQSRQLDRERAARSQAESANRAKTEFLATMSHELRTPLNAIIGYAALLDLGLGGSLTKSQHEHVQRIRHGAHHLLGLVNEALDLSRMETGRLEVQHVPTRASASTSAALAIVQPLAEEHNIALSVRGMEGDIVYYGDDDRVRQILVNLLSNAVKFTDSGGSVDLIVETAEKTDVPSLGHAPGPWVRMCVMDTGIGIPEDKLNLVFEPFRQVHSGRTRPADGSGLGLTVSRKLARLMNGDVTVTSEPGRGSTFTLWLPAAERDEPALIDAPNDSPGADSPNGRRYQGLAAAGSAILRNLHPLIEVVVERLRLECPIPGTSERPFSQLADHVASHIADIGGMLISLEELGARPNILLSDAEEIHRVLAARHGAQRASLGWNDEAIHCEFGIIREEVRRILVSHAVDAATDEAHTVIDRFLDQSEETCLAALNRVRSARRTRKKEVTN